LVSLGLSAAPLLASAWVGVMQLLSRRVRMGAQLEIGGKRGRVTATSLFDTTLTDDDGHVVRVPHLLSLIAPVREHASSARVSVSIAVAAGPAAGAVQSLLLETAGAAGGRAEVELCAIDADGALFRVSLTPDADKLRSASDLRLLLAAALERGGFALGHARHHASHLLDHAGRRTGSAP
jgi:hypothetical protein